tara:strand:- start:527 stop:2962 length:2436 start_codon:yes stop_codon:yes gene_type:complete
VAYSVDIRIKTTGSKQLDSVVQKVNKLNGIIKSIKPVPDLFQRQRGGTEAFREQINAVKKTLADTLATFGQVGKVTGFSKTIGGLNSQLAGFRNVANSAKVGSKQFTEALIAGENASRQLLKAELERLNTLRNLYQTNAKLATGSSVGIGKQLTEVLKIGKTIPKTIASLNEYKSVLNEIIQLVDIGSKEYNELELAIEKVNKQLDSTKSKDAINKKELQDEKNITNELKKQKKIEDERFKRALKNIRQRKRERKQQRQGRLLGAGFPLLFGGGLGSVAGSLAGSFVAKPGEEFGAQIFGSAIGAQLETLIKRANALADAVDQISFEKLEEQSIIVSGELRAQVELLKELGRADEARVILAKQVQQRTGANADVQKDINRQVQLLNAGFSELVNSAGTTLGIIGGPLLTAVGALSAGVSLFFRGFNTLASGLRNLIPDLPVVDEFFKKFNKRIQEATGNTAKLKRELQIVGDIQFTKFSIEMEKTFGKAAQTFDAQRDNLKLQKDIISLRNREEKANALKGVTDKGVRAETEKNFADKLKFDLFKVDQQLLLIDEKEESINNKLKRRLDLSLAQNNFTKKIMKANRDDDVKTAARLEFERDKVNLQFALGEKLREAKSVEQEIAFIKQHMADIDKLRLVLAGKLNSEADKIKDAFEAVGEAINNDIKEGIKGLIKGTATLSDMLNNIADKFLDVALNQALFGSILGSKGDKGGGILGALGLFADGGRPPVNRPSIVGEKGPELFVPRSSGNIIPNNKLGGGSTSNVVVNVDASGSDVQGDEAEAKELGTLISVAVQGELLKQQRPGGLLSR